MATTATIQRIFQRHGWHFRADQDGDVFATFNGVHMLLSPESAGVRILAKLYDPAQSERGAFLAKAGDLQTFLAAVGRVAPAGYFEYDSSQAHMGVWYHLFVPLEDGLQDDQLLTQAIAITVSAVQAIGPVVREIVQGRLSLRQALDILDRAVAEINRSRGLRSA